MFGEHLKDEPSAPVYKAAGWMVGIGIVVAIVLALWRR